MGRAAWIWLVAAGCGRIGFDPVGSTPGGDGGAIARSCLHSDTAPDPITVSGTALRVTVIGIYPESGVKVDIATSSNGAPVATLAMTDASGNFSLQVPTGGVPIQTFISLSRADLLTSYFVPDEPIDHDLTGNDGFVANDNATNQLYTVPSPNLTRDLAKGTMLVTVVDCAGNGIAGATISLTPPAEKIIYSTAGGLPSSSATATTSAGRAWALNAPAGAVQLTAAKSGLTFLPHTVDIQAGSYFMGSQMRPVTP